VTLDQKLDQKLDQDRIERIEVLRGAPCGATWLAADKVRGLPLSEAMTRFGLEVQFFLFRQPGRMGSSLRQKPGARGSRYSHGSPENLSEKKVSVLCSGPGPVFSAWFWRPALETRSGQRFWTLILNTDSEHRF
jgi:hypothetical protein